MASTADHGADGKEEKRGAALAVLPDVVMLRRQPLLLPVGSIQCAYMCCSYSTLRSPLNGCSACAGSVVGLLPFAFGFDPLLPDLT